MGQWRGPSGLHFPCSKHPTQLRTYFSCAEGRCFFLFLSSDSLVCLDLPISTSLSKLDFNIHKPTFKLSFTQLPKPILRPPTASEMSVPTYTSLDRSYELRVHGAPIDKKTTRPRSKTVRETQWGFEQSRDPQSFNLVAARPSKVRIHVHRYVHYFPLILIPAISHLLFE